ncbi:DUF2382 domain-containing protein [Streptomyces sp. NRRL B-24484]|uniref:DUF2382 domain-containing protein n=1 Tax=Streptomyces sp. NRRL B-24484 TaxID=1463833 RepID=UPI0007C51444|nr:DUF2382 domain-containing protein [Streptomyces sp. NRRL B-24484]
MQTDIDPRDLIGHKAVDRNGEKIGTVDEVYLDDATGEPEWAAVRTGIFGRDAFVPLTTSEFSGEELKVPYDKSLVKESPDFGVGQHLSPAQELQLYRYYGLDVSGGARPGPEAAPQSAGRTGDAEFGTVARTAAGQPAANGRPATDGRTADGRGRTDHADGQHGGARHDGPRQDGSRQDSSENTMQLPVVPAGGAVRPLAAPTAAHRPERQQGGEASAHGPVEIVCREERLDISTEWHVLGTARLRKYVTSEAVERRVPVVRERVRVERVPVSDAERAALSDQEIAEAVEEVTLREERPVVRKYLAPVERVRLVVERYTEEELVREELRREQVEVHDETGRRPFGPQPADRASAPAGHAPANGRPAHGQPADGQPAQPSQPARPAQPSQPSQPAQGQPAHGQPAPHASGPTPVQVAARAAAAQPPRPEPLRPV